MINNEESVFLRNFVVAQTGDDDSDLDRFALKVNLNILKGDVHTLFNILLQLVNKLEAEKTELQSRASVLEANLSSAQQNISSLQTSFSLSQNNISSLETRLAALEQAFYMLTKA